MNNTKLPVIGWREWASLPSLGVKLIKVKVDSGARSSSLHAFNVSKFTKHGEDWVRFDIAPVQRSSKKTVAKEAKILEYRSVRSSSGKASMRPVILTDIELLGQRWAIELTLANRDAMGFRMLLGREAFRGRFLVDAGQSYYGGKPRKARRPSENKSGKSSKGKK